MAAKRKKWKVTYPAGSDIDTFPSQKRTYEWLRDLARSHAAGAITDGRAVVWVDEGDSRGWQRHDEVDVAEWAASSTSATEV
jgi:hypothetical protein